MNTLSTLPPRDKETICAFTGHRSLGEDFDAEALYEEIKKLLFQGVYVYVNGLAMGFDLMAAELLLSLKEEYPKMKLIACIPCKEQDKYYSEEDKIRYRNILVVADEVVLLSERYYNGCMQARDRYMAEFADVLLAYCKKNTGGTAYTVRYFQKKKPDGKIIFL